MQETDTLQATVKVVMIVVVVEAVAAGGHSTYILPPHELVPGVLPAGLRLLLTMLVLCRCCCLVPADVCCVSAIHACWCAAAQVLLFLQLYSLYCRNKCTPATFFSD
jgi:hypothetical protein